MALTAEQRRELSTLVADRSVDAVVAGRARMVLWRDEGLPLPKTHPPRWELVCRVSRMSCAIACAGLSRDW